MFIVQTAAILGHFYPLRSGCGPFANSAFFRWLDPLGGDDAIARVKGGRALVPAGDYVARAMRFVGDLDPKVSWVIDRSVLPGDTVLDIGGNLGLVTLRMASLVGPQGNVHTFEPQPRMLKYLQKTLALNPSAPITIHGLALGDRRQTLSLSIPSGNAGSASFSVGTRGDHETVEVPIVTLDDYAAEIGLEHVEVIKMDVEGFESQVLNGASHILATSPPRVIVFEENTPYPDGALAKSMTLLQDFGYELYGLPRKLLRVDLVPIIEHPSSHDFVAVHASCDLAIKRALRIN